jgi:RNA polymerase sigma factor (sigma-70 family)
MSADDALVLPRRLASAASFDDFFVRERPSLVRALALALGDVDLASEAVDEAMVRALGNWDRICGYDNPAGWVYRVALNWATSVLRRRRRGHRVAPSFERPTEVDVADPAIAAAVSALDVDHRAVIVCRFYLGWSEAETATALGIRPGTVKSRLSRASARLRHQLASLEDFA